MLRNNDMEMGETGIRNPLKKSNWCSLQILVPMELFILIPTFYITGEK